MKKRNKKGKRTKQQSKNRQGNGTSRYQKKKIKPVDFHGRNPITVIMLADSAGIIGDEWTAYGVS
jgi:hypothetical protein